MLGQLIDRFGVEAVMGRPYLGMGEMIKINAAERVVRGYRMKANSENWSKWARDNPKDAEKLVEVEKLIAEMEEPEDG